MRVIVWASIAIGCVGCARAYAATLGADLRACSAISRSQSSPRHSRATAMRECRRSRRAQRAAVCQLPLFASARLGLTISTEGRDGRVEA